MAKGEVIETIFGKYNKYEITKEPGPGYSPDRFFVYKDGKCLGYFDSLSDAVEAAKKEG